MSEIDRRRSAAEERDAPRSAERSSGRGLIRVFGALMLVCGASMLLLAGAAGALALVADAALGAAGELAASGNEGAFRSLVADLGVVLEVKGGMLLALAGLSLAAAIAGIGLLRRRRWGITLALVWAAVGLCFLVADVMVDAWVVLPALDRAALALGDEIAGDGFEAVTSGVPVKMLGSLSGLGLVGAISNAVFFAVLPILSLFVLSKNKIAQAAG
ncbi:MAG: hypothetical protein R6V85_00915 [Polyangia bacterium]